MAEKRGAQFIVSIQFTLDEGETSQTIDQKIKAAEEEDLAAKLRELQPAMKYETSIKKAKKLLWND